MQNVMCTTDPAATIKCWVELYSDSMYSWALHKTSCKETAEDLVQETFFASVQSFHRFKGESNPKTWLFAILNNKISDHYRSSYRKPIMDDNMAAALFFNSDGHWNSNEKPRQWPEDDGHLLDDAAFKQTLQHCMGKLPANWYAAIQLKFMQEKTGDYICQELGISNTNFWQILHRAKLQLRKCIEFNWFK